MQKANIGFDSRKVKENNLQNQKNKRKKIWPTILVIFLFLMLILGVGSYIVIKYLANKAGENIEERLGPVSNSDWQDEWQQITEGTKEDTVNKRLEEERGAERDILSDGEVAISLNLVERHEEIGEEKAREGYEFVVLKLHITNQKYEEILFYNSNFILRDSRYTEYNVANIESDEINVLKGMQNIPSRDWIEGSIIYEVQKEVGTLEFLYTGEKKLIFELN
ncbi:MAG: DUF4352 domain-containing protein [Parcubacteria group bacterium]|nr:DUF4352 domain-containing protein [Parcubacteria group bacterium]